MTRITIGTTSASGVRWPNYVNGRLLTATDLATSHDAVLQRLAWLGAAVGAGIVSGLEVTGAPGSSELLVSPGTGVTLGGTAVHLLAPVSLTLTTALPPTEATSALFGDCRPTDTSTGAPTAGAYLLAASPTSTYDGRVPVQGPPTATLPTPCTSRWEVEGLRFTATRLDDFTTATTPSNRQSLLAHWCFGSDSLEALAMSGFTDPVPHSPLAALADLGPDDLPLAVFDWDGAALTFVDQWSARRRPTRPSATAVLTDVVSDERSAEGEARFLQFQQQLAGELARPAGATVTAAAVFPVLPPAGLVPFDPLATFLHVAPVGVVADQPTPQRMVFEDVKRFRDHVRMLEVFQHGAGATVGVVTKQIEDVQQRIDALQDQVDELRASRGGADGRVADQAGRRRLGLQLTEQLLDVPGTGVDLAQFFAGATLRVGVVDHETVDFTLRRSWCDESFPVAGTTLNIFFVLTSDERSIAPYVLFCKRHRGIRWLDWVPDR